MSIFLDKVLDPEGDFVTAFAQFFRVFRFWLAEVLTMRTILALNDYTVCANAIINRTIQSSFDELWTTEAIKEPKLVRHLFWQHTNPKPRILNRIHIEHLTISVLLADPLCILFTFIDGIWAEQVLAKFNPVILAKKLGPDLMRFRNQRWSLKPSKLVAELVVPLTHRVVYGCRQIRQHLRPIVVVHLHRFVRAIFKLLKLLMKWLLSNLI